jgi:hypothetical protein
MQENTQRMNVKTANMAEEAKQLVSRIQEIVNNTELTEQMTCDQIESIVGAASIETRKELGVKVIDCKKIFGQTKGE